MEALAPGHTAEKCKCRCWSSGQPDPLTSCLTVWGSLILSRTPGKYSPLVRNFSLHNTHTVQAFLQHFLPRVMGH